MSFILKGKKIKVRSIPAPSAACRCGSKKFSVIDIEDNGSLDVSYECSKCHSRSWESHLVEY